MTQGSGPSPLDDLGARLEKLRGAGTGEEAPRRSRAGGGFQAGVEVIAGVIGGALIGYGLDWGLGTAPLFFIILFMLGAAAGVLNAWRTLSRSMGEIATGAPAADGSTREGRDDGR